MKREARAAVPGLRQTTQFTCVAASVTGALRAYGVNVHESDVNRILGASPGRGASWEEALGCLQYFGMRGRLVVPATLGMLKEWTSKGVPVLIGWNPEGRPWSHASVVVDVDTEENIHVMDPNCPDPDQTFRIVPKREFFKKWYEEMGDVLIRRPALAVTPEITPDGRQVVASNNRTKLAFADGQEAFTASEIESALEEVREAKWKKGEKVPLEKLPKELQENVENDALGLKGKKKQNKSAHLADLFDEEPADTRTASAGAPRRPSGRVRITERKQTTREAAAQAQPRPAAQSKRQASSQPRRKLAAFAPTVEEALNGKVDFDSVYDTGTHLVVGGIETRTDMRTASTILSRGYGEDRVSLDALEGQIIISKL